MKKGIALVCMVLSIILVAGAASADDIAGRLGVTGRIGFLVPSDGETTVGPYHHINTDVGFVFGGGFIYGITRNIAAEVDVTRTSFGGDFGSFNTDFSIINVSLGGQYRFDIPVKKLVPYAGGGLDILVNGIDKSGFSVDTVVGAHLSGGVDYFLMKQLAATSELKVVIAPTADITDHTGKVGNFDPTSFSMTFGLRYFFN